MSFDIQSYRLGKRSIDRLVERLGRILGDEVTAELAGLLVGARDCGEVEERLQGYFAWQGLRWAYSPRGLPPSEKMLLLMAVVCREGIPVDEDFLKEMSQPPGAIEEGGEVE
ncbi:hypothetical protein [Aeropyrum globular virus 1]|uniref:hypothetical protein n=1 Tax=Aeropyrum globular virus 1 TaxID=1932713 RepID=UPI000C7E861F|nr:hypothetical protein C1186_gp30 [Aeropyrum globular virus 1]BBC20955.1 hypothetical protein [Aeropyrum globular virus 1]